MGVSSSTVKKLFNLSNGDNNNSEAEENKQTQRRSPLVLSRKGSMYFDEDGDLAHEFYVEEKPRTFGSKATMRKIQKNSLTPQGDVDHLYPRLHVDFPVIIHED